MHKQLHSAADSDVFRKAKVQQVTFYTFIP